MTAAGRGRSARPFQRQALRLSLVICRLPVGAAPTAGAPLPQADVHVLSTHPPTALTRTDRHPAGCRVASYFYHPCACSGRDLLSKRFPARPPRGAQDAWLQLCWDHPVPPSHSAHTALPPSPLLCASLRPEGPLSPAASLPACMHSGPRLAAVRPERASDTTCTPVTWVAAGAAPRARQRPHRLTRREASASR